MKISFTCDIFQNSFVFVCPVSIKDFLLKPRQSTLKNLIVQGSNVGGDEKDNKLSIFHPLSKFNFRFWVKQIMFTI